MMGPLIKCEDQREWSRRFRACSLSWLGPGVFLARAIAPGVGGWELPASPSWGLTLSPSPSARQFCPRTPGLHFPGLPSHCAGTQTAAGRTTGHLPDQVRVWRPQQAGRREGCICLPEVAQGRLQTGPPCWPSRQPCPARLPTQCWSAAPPTSARGMPGTEERERVPPDGPPEVKQARVDFAVLGGDRTAPSQEAGWDGVGWGLPSSPGQKDPPVACPPPPFLCPGRSWSPA